MKKVLTPQQEQQVINSYNSNKTPTEICEELNISKSNFDRILSKHGVERRFKKHSSKEDIEKMKDLYKANKSFAQIGKIVGVNERTVSRIMEKEGLYQKAVHIGRPNKD